MSNAPFLAGLAQPRLCGQPMKIFSPVLTNTCSHRGAVSAAVPWRYAAKSVFQRRLFGGVAFIIFVTFFFTAFHGHATQSIYLNHSSFILIPLYFGLTLTPFNYIRFI